LFEMGTATNVSMHHQVSVDSQSSNERDKLPWEDTRLASVME